MRKIFFVFLLGVFFLTACQQSTDLGMKVESESCMITGVSGRCRSYFNSVRGKNIHYYDKVVFTTYDSAYLEMEVSAEKGELTVVIINYDNEPVEYLVKPEKPARIALWVRGDHTGTLPIQFNTVENNIVEGVPVFFEYVFYNK